MKLPAVAVALLALAACNPQSKMKPRADVDGHTRMVTLLDKIRKDALEDHFYFGKRNQIRNDQLELSQLNRAQIEQRFELNWRLATNCLRIGDFERAMAYFAAAQTRLQQSLVVDPQLQRKFHWDLAIGFMRQGEVENCLSCRTGEACIVPIQAGGVHAKKRGSTAAIRVLSRILAQDAKNLRAIWLLNLAYMTLGKYPQEVPKKYLIPPERFKAQGKFPKYVDQAAAMGLRIVNCAGGVVVDDFTGDGWNDILTSDWHVGGQIRFFVNNKNGTFTETTKAAGLVGLYGGLNLVQADYDNDGDIDVLVLRGAWLGKSGQHPNSLLANDGKGHFRDVTFAANLGQVHFPTQTAAWADYDNDGDVDLYVGNESFASQLFRNNGNGTFSNVADVAGVENKRLTKGVVWGDYDNDRYPDIYVSNLDGPNRLYRNNGDGTFTDVAPAAGVTKPNQSFPVWFWDYNNDGALDLFVSSYWPGTKHVAADYLDLPRQDEPDCLYQGDGQGGFREVGRQHGLNRVTQPMGANFGDLDNDGYLDFYLGTGFNDYEGLMPNLMFRNVKGTRFEEVTIDGGFGHLQKGHGVAFADLDRDGTCEVFIQMGGTFLGDAFGNIVFKRPKQAPGNWISVKLEGKRSNRSAIGARIRVDLQERGAKRSIFRWVGSGGSFGAGPLAQHVGLGKATKIDLLEVYWPTTGVTQRFRSVMVNQHLVIQEGARDIAH